MIDLLSSAQILLREAGFATGLSSIDGSQLVRFEDDTLMGFGWVFTSADEMISHWKAIETALLTQYAPRLRGAGEKAWNVYSVFLSSAGATSSQARQVHWIEENLDRTRKIAACGVTTREELRRALFPLLPLQQKPALRAEDVTERLQRRAAEIAPKASRVVLDDDVPVDEVVRILVNGQ
jgi:hypothetical protein